MMMMMDSSAAAPRPSSGWPRPRARGRGAAAMRSYSMVRSYAVAPTYLTNKSGVCMGSMGGRRYKKRADKELSTRSENGMASFNSLSARFLNPPVSGRGVNLRSIWVYLVTFDANLHVIGGNLIPEETLKRPP
jgi:hypothetical protein